MKTRRHSIILVQLRSLKTKSNNAGKVAHWLICLAIASFVFCGCTAQLEIHEEAVESLLSENIAQKRIDETRTAAESTTLGDDGWLRKFNDPQLLSLVEEAMANNRGLNIAVAQVDLANRITLQSNESLQPDVDLSEEDADRNSAVYDERVTISWEADVWKRVRSGVATGLESSSATAADFNFVRQSLAASTSRAWFLAIASKLKFQLSHESVQILGETLRIVSVKEKDGHVSPQDVYRARAKRTSTQKAARNTRTAMQNAQRGLELLLGRSLAADIETADKLAVPPPVPTDCSSQLLERRPDLINAEQSVAAAFSKEKEAELMHLPRFNFAVGALTNLNDAMSNLDAAIFAPLYAGGAIESEMKTATTKQKIAVAAYAQKALQAFKEVESALSAEQTLQDRETYMKSVVVENKNKYDLTMKQFEIGEIDVLDVLSAQDKWLAARIALLNISMGRLMNRIDLHLALGGSFH